ncbi:hypothetical protein [Testudinibacter sp. TR-2022]|uniref:COG4648 family protein n=1 Tax=Testudinibacter sp. TR-2022 TaxID=2585029 RepID=UPI0011197FA0|nr:hypothetical protein [Testudinibacter sp. TR-2022]TNH06001.1 DNA gyrase subunit B [Pasteurellaceae bacterium Phil11]TNH24298.1 DNA gyrase subunit B [Testudinibacter sp. TR-2022]TNH26889.1 DNA gyrase subunit B [Testudinibacter sp. TR-2022]
MKKSLNGLTTLLLVAYPFFVFFSLENLPLHWLLLGLTTLFLLRLILVLRQSAVKQRGYLIFLGAASALIGIGVSVYAFLANSATGLLFYPLLVNLLCLGLFLFSLVFPPTVIELFARLVEKDLSPQGVVYTRKVTWAWCGFFLFNGSISLLTALQDNVIYWTWYNGFISYILIGLFFIIELMVRRIVRQRDLK